MFVKLTRLKIFVALTLFSFIARAGDLSWSGLYRFEAISVLNSELDKDLNRNKDYGLHHLILRPKIVASDGVYIYGRFDFLNNSVNDQLGQVWGSPRSTGATILESSNAFAQNNPADTVQVTNLYITLQHEFGQIIAGRVPFQFGLGITHNSGEGFFDHWYDSRDMVAYKMVFGSWHFTPMIAKLSEGALKNANADDVNELNFLLEYDNPESDMEMGILYQIRKASKSANDTPVGNAYNIGGASSTIGDQVDANDFNIYLKRNMEDYYFGVEASFQTGKTGVKDVGDNTVKRKGYAVAFEFEYHPKVSPYHFGGYFGIASGDDANTTDDYEGFLFDRNYDVATLLFNHPLGQADVFATQVNGGGGSSNIGSFDVEQINNIIYLAPYFRHILNDNWNWQAKLVTGTLQETVAGAGSNIGLEVDLSLSYKPHERLEWTNEFAYFTAGDAFKYGASNYKTDNAMAFISKVAIGF